MSKPIDERLQRVVDDQSPEVTPERDFRNTVARWIEGRKNLYTFTSTLLALVGLAMVFRGGTVLRFGLSMQRPELTTNGSLMLMLGFAALFFDKLWFRIASNHAHTQQQLLLLRSEISQMRSGQETDEAKDNVKESLDPMVLEGLHGRLRSVWGSVSNRTVQRISVVMVLAGAVVAGLTLTGAPGDSSRITQIDQWRIVSSDGISARSTIRFEQIPKSGRFVTLTLPYSTAEITSMVTNDQALPFSRQDWRTFEVELPIGSYPSKPFEISVNWDLPIDSLAIQDGGYRTTLCSLLPVSSYRLEVSVDDESGYEVAGPTEHRNLVPFNSGTQLEERAFFGSCHIGVRKVPTHNSDVATPP
jgi:hypothetical protein